MVVIHDDVVDDDDDVPISPNESLPHPYVPPRQFSNLPVLGPWDLDSVPR